MQDQFFVQFVEAFREVFIGGLHGSLPHYVSYASTIFYGIATLEVVFAGLLMATSSGTSIYTLLSRLIKISIFFFIITHFDELIRFVFDAINYISVHTLTDSDVSSVLGNGAKLSDLWDFTNPSNYVTQGLTRVMNDFSSMSDVVHNQANNMVSGMQQSGDMANQQGQSPDLPMNSLLYMGETLMLGLTAILALANIILFYFTALLALLMCPFGQISVTSGFFQASFSKFISAGLRLLSFTVIFIMFSFFYGKLAQMMPDLLPVGVDSSLAGFPSGATPEMGEQQSFAPEATSLLSFMMALFGLFLCWFIPKEISSKVGSFVIPELPGEAQSPVLPAPASPVAGGTLSDMQRYNAGGQPLSGSLASQTSVLPLQNATGTSPAVTSMDARISGVPVQSGSGQKVTIKSGDVSGKKKGDTLRKQTSFTQNRFSRERASILRQNFHRAMNKSEK